MSNGGRLKSKSQKIGLSHTHEYLIFSSNKLDCISIDIKNNEASHKSNSQQFPPAIDWKFHVEMTNVACATEC